MIVRLIRRVGIMVIGLIGKIRQKCFLGTTVLVENKQHRYTRI